LNLGAGPSHDIGPDPQSVRSQVFVANPRLKVGETSRERCARRHDRLGRREPEGIAARPNGEGRGKRPSPRGVGGTIEIAIRSPTGHEPWKFSIAPSTGGARDRACGSAHLVSSEEVGVWQRFATNWAIDRRTLSNAAVERSWPSR